jgi:hypothetical protein
VSGVPVFETAFAISTVFTIPARRFFGGGL